ncbi:MAG TPA: TrmH family RNA methyltransferase, partial [Candidatus Binataceae bacterium]
MAAEEGFAFILVRTKAAGNIGAAARALANMGFGDLRLVAPDASADRVASEMAVHGREILRRATTYPDLGAALHDRILSIGTTCRPGFYRSTAQPLRSAISELAADNPRGPIGFVFGPEDHGLSNDDLRYCQRLITIPTAPQYSSINLAQSVMLVAYELLMACGLSGGAIAPAGGSHQRLLATAPVGEIEMMLGRMEKALVRIGFLAEDSPERIMFALRGILGR